MKDEAVHDVVPAAAGQVLFVAFIPYVKEDDDDQILWVKPVVAWRVPHNPFDHELEAVLVGSFEISVPANAEQPHEYLDGLSIKALQMANGSIVFDGRLISPQEFSDRAFAALLDARQEHHAKRARN